MKLEQDRAYLLQTVLAIADEEEMKIISALPKEHEDRALLFIESLKAIDYFATFSDELPKDINPAPHQDTILRWGVGRLIGILYASIMKVDGYVVTDYSKEYRGWCLSILYALGTCVLLRRLAKMFEMGVVEVKNKNHDWTIFSSHKVKSQHHDFAYLVLDDELQAEMGGDDGFDEKQIRAEIRELMHPWHVGDTQMIGYKSSELTNDFFITTARRNMHRCAKFAGFCEGITLTKNITTTDIINSVCVVSSLHLKHMECMKSGLTKFGFNAVQNTITLYSTENDLVDEFNYLYGMEKYKSLDILDIISLTPQDLEYFSNKDMEYPPLLIKANRNIYLRPLSSVVKNPFYQIKRMLEWKIPDSINKITRAGEKDLRQEIVKALPLSDYICRNNINIRKNKSIVTDIDLAIYSKQTSELALFQLKWQDYATNDAKKLVSKAKNLSTELDTWAAKIDEWLNTTSSIEITRSLQLKVSNPISSVFLFAISREYAHTQGFGHFPSHPKLATCSLSYWRHLLKAFDGNMTFARLHRVVSDEHDGVLMTKDTPVTIQCGGNNFLFLDFWQKFDLLSIKNHKH